MYKSIFKLLDSELQQYYEIKFRQNMAILFLLKANHLYNKRLTQLMCYF